MLDSDWLIAVIFFTNSDLAFSVNGKNGKYDFANTMKKS
jgi:hypothetical protein